MTNNRQHTTDKGFTIVESLVSIFILVSVITGVASTVQTSISSYVYSKDQIIAFNLAQEGIEMVRNTRDINAINSENWLAEITADSDDPCFFGSACTVSPIEAPHLISCGASNCNSWILRRDPITGFLGYNPSWILTTFKREIKLTQINTDEISVLVTIDWSKGMVNRQFKARENLFNIWK